MATIAQFVRGYLKAHPGATNREISRALDKQGIITSANYVAKIKTRMKNSATVRPQHRQGRYAQEGCPSDEEDTHACIDDPPT